MKDKGLHRNCFKCSECGMSLVNKPHSLVKDKFYCDLHGKQASSRTENVVILPSETEKLVLTSSNQSVEEPTSEPTETSESEDKAMMPPPSTSNSQLESKPELPRQESSEKLLMSLIGKKN